MSWRVAEMSETKRPLIDATIRTEFGDFLADKLEGDGGQGTDPTFTPGFSEMRLNRDIALGEVAKGTRKREDVPTLTHNVRLVRRTKASGAPDGAKLSQSAVLGYRAVKKSDIGQPWFTVMPAGAVELPGGEIGLGDCVYHVADARTAGRNEALKFKRMVEMADLQFDRSADVREGEGNLGPSLGAAGGAVKKLPGTGPLTKKDVMSD
jgi:hypothetical protein